MKYLGNKYNPFIIFVFGKSFLTGNEGYDAPKYLSSHQDKRKET